ncbi:MAG TPA: DUF4350 domain-containing protein [Candidatus Acidoferrales bacterium]|nr:DUF4350 domain-containing protein [Candidatus Acidoferrales bacterium]
MRNLRGWVGLGLLALVVAVAAFQGGRPDSPEHSSSSDARSGTSALRQLARELGHPSGQLSDRFELPASGLLFVFTPTRPFSSEEAASLRDWVVAGGMLVYAAEAGDSRLDAALGLQRGRGLSLGRGEMVLPVVRGARELEGGGATAPFQAGPGQAVAVRSSRGAALGVVERLGRGRVVALADPLPLCNYYLPRSDNGRFAADLIGLAAPGSPVRFDEYHHGLSLAPASSAAWLGTAWGAGLAWAAAALFIGLALRGRAFGPRLPLPGRPLSSAEWSRAVGSLLRRAGARRLVLDTLTRAARRSAAERIGLGREHGAELGPALARRAPGLAQELSAAEAAAAAATSEAELLGAARRLHAVAQPRRSVK